MIDFVCDGCRAQLQIGDGWAGGLGRCPHCGTNTRVPGNPKRTSKLTILARMVAFPFVLVAFWGLMFCIVDVSKGFALVMGGVIAVALALFFCWGFTNLCTFVFCRREYRLIKNGGGDPFYDSLDPPFNTDPPFVRYQELFRERARQECEQVDRMLGRCPPTPPDATKGIGDQDVI